MTDVLVLDIETIPDRAVWTPPEPETVDLTKCSECDLPLTEEEKDVRKCTAMKRGKCRFPKAPKEGEKPFPPKWAHQVCVIGICALKDGLPVYLGSMEAGTPQEEKGALEHLHAFLETNPYTLVTWNGNGFDLPVIALRSLRHGLAQRWRDLTASRYNDQRHIDLADVVSNFQYSKTKGEFSLDSVARLIGLPGKEGFDGSMVEETVKAGEIGIVADYCKRDVVQTTYVYLRTRLLRGEIDTAGYHAACIALKALWLPEIPRWAEDTDFVGGSPINFNRLELR